MANPLPNEKELYEQISNERIKIDPEIWDLLYNRIGDDVSSVNLLCQYYLEAKQPVPVNEAKKILMYNRHIKEIIREVTVVSKKDFYFPEFSDNMPLHPIIREMFTHYIGNDVHIINLIVQDTIDPIDPKPLSLEIIKKILTHTRSIKEFMNRLREATLEGKKGHLSAPPKKELSKEEISQKLKERLRDEFKIKDASSIKPETRFKEDLGLDSVDSLEAVMCIEETFGFEMPDADIDKILTFAHAVDYIYKRLKELS